MAYKFKTVSLVCAAALVVGMTGGCATSSDIEKLQAEVAKSTEAANRAAASADAARREAAEAAKLAQEAKSASEHSNRVALDAQAMAQETDSRIDRMFKKAMYK